ncbi:unnamed protein product, partial [Mesorhabditis belari]|uniref:inositol-polyphosphate 5-phosphatase n=1 Tax=Mesorhabditis belari TaxID=2138241 RepID=A0AAF3FKR1_9BILA
MQETGGKNFQQCSNQVPGLVQRLYDRIKHEYPVARAVLDIDFEQEMYTALGSMYFVRSSSVDKVAQYNFEAGRYERLKDGIEMITKDLDKLPFVIKQKFPKHFWPSFRWGRKGFVHARFRYAQHYFDLVNVHLFHDENNLALIHENPNLYSANRQRALAFVLAHLKNTQNGHPSYSFLFGDLNFRLDSTRFLNQLTAATESHPIGDSDLPHGSVANCLNLNVPHEVQHSSSGHELENHLSLPTEQLRRTVSAIEFRREISDDSDSDQASERSFSKTNCVLRIEKKRFEYFNAKKLLQDWNEYLEFDFETKAFPELHEIPIDFPPTYPWSEDPAESNVLMKTRAPAWCDRVLMNERAWKLVKEGDASYQSFGQETCMGDHKPVYLCFAVTEQ